MAIIRRSFGDPRRAAHNGHGAPTTIPVRGRRIGAPSNFSGAEREATRYLSAATQVDIGYAESVVERIMNERFRALAPTFGVDVPVVARWALKALRTRRTRDYILSVVLITLLLPPILLFPHPQGLIPIPAMLIVAWLVVSWETWERFHNVIMRRMLRDRFNPGDAPEPPNKDARERLEEVAKRRDGNLVVFSGHSAFIGSGEKIRYQHLLLDVSRGRKADDDKGDDEPVKPDPFTSQDLHTALVKAFDCETGLAKSLDNIKVYERLFVNGLHIQHDNRLLPDPLRPPRTSIDPGLLISAALHPTSEARTYVCVEMPGWEGQLVVTLFIRAVHTGASLYVDWTFRVLPPLLNKFLRIDRLYEVSRFQQLRTSLNLGLRETMPSLLQAPYKTLRAWVRPYRNLRYRSRQSHAIKSGYVFDYGARKSIREDACGKQRQHYFLARDETMYVLLAEQTLTRAVGTFLDEHKVDLGQFDNQVKVIFDNSISIQDSTGIAIGNNASSNVQGVPRGEK